MKGIYKITNIENGKFYIGSSKKITTRWDQHLKNLYYKCHHSHKLQKAYDEYGFKSFTFQILEYVDSEKELLEREQDYINATMCYKDEIGYNVNPYVNYKHIAISDGLKDMLVFSDNIKSDIRLKLKNNLNILKDDRLNSIGDKKTSLSKTYFNKNGNKITIIKNNIYNYFQNKVKSRSKDLAWTCFIDSQKALSGKGYATSFVSLNGKIESEKNKRNNLAFMCNCFINGFEKREAIKNDIIVNSDKYSLSILLNWILNVSDMDKPINIYIPSSRMRNLLIDYLG